MEITGKMIIGASDVAGDQGSIHAINPATGEQMQPAFLGGSNTEVDRACALASDAFDTFRKLSLSDRADFISKVADNILGLGDTLVQRAMQETGLPEARIVGERGRTVGQLKQFADVVRSGQFQEPRIDTAMPDRAPLPRLDHRFNMIPLGPVAVFGASNFPLAFSVAGGDTASAFAAGCPVVVKAHSSHPGTSELVGNAIRSAVKECGLPEGVFSLLFGNGTNVGASLVAHPSIKAVGFTGSEAGGTALMKIAAARPEPIPVYAEMSSINPVFLLPEALNQRAEAIADAQVASMQMGAGQFCTSPGLLVALKSDSLDTFVAAAAKALGVAVPQTMLSPGIYDAYVAGIERLSSVASNEQLAVGQETKGPYECRPALFKITAADFLANEHLTEEVFGSASLIVEAANEEEMFSVIASLGGQLTGSIHADDAENPALVQRLVDALELKVGRIIWNGFGTGVEVCHAMVHGGPFPATSDSRTTSVGTAAISRFLRPVCYQNMPEAFLPSAVKEANPQGLTRLVDGKLV